MLLAAELLRGGGGCGRSSCPAGYSFGFLGHSSLRMAGIGPNVDWKVGETAHYLPAAEPPARKVTVLVVCHDASGTWWPSHQQFMQRVITAKQKDAILTFLVYLKHTED